MIIPIKTRYSNSALGIVMWAVFFGMPALLVNLNPPPPESELAHFHAKILRVSERPPNLVVETDKGERRELRFPTPLYMVFSGKTSFLGLSSEQETRLPGCDAEIYGADVRYLRPSSFRVWKVGCRSAPVSYEQIATKYRSMNHDYGYVPWLGIFFVSLAVVLMFIGDKNRSLK
ncbi:hypothetical protein G3N95_35435 [Paraburkholderia sp. Tr-20389]|uniref:hypothetical protein n=1 Tax=Paraburkholderia sp. Tr-20389 TaxID=2703903 RepID=UPI001981AAA5|nr:hypothetical protein [Paraburkholderia sp. Tr-20389]MBN3758252.1 hypothetical protein [Paraburkholderia sp. Tr-20389]